MSNRLRSLGLPIDDIEQFSELAHLAVELGDVHPTPEGSAYISWAMGLGCELWVMADADRHLLGCSPHYRGARITLHDATISPSEDPEVGALEGILHAALPASKKPIHVHLADALLATQDHDSGAPLSVSLAGFAHAVEVLDEQTRPLTLAAETPPDDPAVCAVSGRIEEISQRVNPASKQRFWHLVLEIGQEAPLEIVASTRQLGRRPRTGRLIDGLLWLSACASTARTDTAKS